MGIRTRDFGRYGIGWALKSDLGGRLDGLPSDTLALGYNAHFFEPKVIDSSGKKSLHSNNLNHNHPPPDSDRAVDFKKGIV